MPLGGIFQSLHSPPNAWSFHSPLFREESTHLTSSSISSITLSDTTMLSPSVCIEIREAKTNHEQSQPTIIHRWIFSYNKRANQQAILTRRINATKRKLKKLESQEYDLWFSFNVLIGLGLVLLASGVVSLFLLYAHTEPLPWCGEGHEITYPAGLVLKSFYGKPYTVGGIQTWDEMKYRLRTQSDDVVVIQATCRVLLLWTTWAAPPTPVRDGVEEEDEHEDEDFFYPDYVGKE